MVERLGSAPHSRQHVGWKQAVYEPREASAVMIRRTQGRTGPGGGGNWELLAPRIAEGTSFELDLLGYEKRCLRFSVVEAYVWQCPLAGQRRCIA